MVQDEGQTYKDEVASIGPYTNYLTLLHYNNAIRRVVK